MHLHEVLLQTWGKLHHRHKKLHFGLLLEIRLQTAVLSVDMFFMSGKGKPTLIQHSEHAGDLS
jgi:hypothetical protein